MLAVSELEDEIEQAIESTADLVGCPGCGAVAALHDRREVRVRDLPSAGRAVTVIWVKRVWPCHHRQCEVTTWTEQSEAIRARASLTEGPEGGVPAGRPGRAHRRLGRRTVRCRGATVSRKA